MGGLSTTRVLLIGLVAVALASFLPLGVSGYILGLLTIAYYFGVFAMAWDLLFGFAGEVNFGPTFLIGTGAYTAGILDNLYQPPIWLCVAAGALAAVIGGVVLALPALRVRGPYFGLTTLVAVLMLQNFVVVDASLTGGEIALTGRADPAGQRPGRGAGRRARLQCHQAQAHRLRHQRLLLRPRRRALGVLSRLGLGRHLHRYHRRRADHHRGGDRWSAHHSRRRARRDLHHCHERSATPGRRSGEFHRLRHGALCRAHVSERLFRPAHPQQRDFVSMADKNAHLEVSGLTKRFGGLVAVKDMALRVDAGKILGLIGPNGSGKSTVMKLIMGIERPDAGSVRINGTEVAGWPSHRIARLGAGIVFQHSRPLHRQTVLENIKLALLPDKLTRLFVDPQTDQRARTIAARVGLSAVLDRRPATLPFADLRKIEIAKAVARDPQVLLIDEPFAGLTSKETAAFSDLICELRDDGRAVLLVDHNVKSVARLVDRVLAMYVGERIAEGSADEVMRNETVRRVYLGGSMETAARPESSFRDAATPFLEIKDVSVHYGKAQALDNVSIHVHAGEFVSVVGLNGAGKTTLFNAVSGLLPYAGDILRQGRPLRGQTAAAIARGGIV